MYFRILLSHLFLLEHCVLIKALLFVIGGKQTVLDIMGMMGCFIVDMEKERLLAQLIPLVMWLVVVSTILHTSSSSRNILT